MALLELVIQGDPVVKGRPRLAPGGKTYTPRPTRTAEQAIASLAAHRRSIAVPTTEAVGIAVEFFCATRRHSDGDNMLKLVTDALNGIIYADDSQLLEYFVRVHRGVGQEAARTEMMVYLLDPPDAPSRDRAVVGTPAPSSAGSRALAVV